MTGKEVMACRSVESLCNVIDIPAAAVVGKLSGMPMVAMYVLSISSWVW